MKILLVDDSQSTTKMISTYLQAQPENYQVNIANNGFQALDHYMKFKPDVVVLDISMPGMDGIETLGRLFKIDKDANIIMATATDAQRTIEICLQKGALGYITKPYSPEKLVATIKNALRGGIYKRDLMTFFSRVANKVEGSIRNMVGNDASVIFKDVDVYPHYSKTFTPRSISSIISVPEIDEVKIDVPAECVGFSTEIGGQLNGVIVSVVNRKDLRTLFLGDDKDSHTIENEDAVFLEFFNIINTNVMSQLADSMNVKLEALPVRTYIKDKDSIVKDKDLTKTKFEISLKERNIPLEIYLWFNMSSLFKKIF